MNDDWKREYEAQNAVLGSAGAFEIVKGISWEGAMPAAVIVAERDAARARVRVLEAALAQAGIAVPDYEEPSELIGKRILERLKAATR